MSPRRRHPRNRQYPDNMREKDGYFSWRNPIDGREKGLGRDRVAAMKWARAANDAVRKITGEASAEQWVRGESARTWGEWLKHYKGILSKRKLSDQTRKRYASQLKKAEAAWPADRAIESIDVAAVAGELRSVADAGKEATAKNYRQLLVDCFREAIAEGWLTANPAEASRRIQHNTQRARLQLDVLQRILDLDLQPWLRNAILLAVVSGQRREDVLRAQRRDIRDGRWWLEQSKTRNYPTPIRIAIPLTLRLDALGISLRDVVDQCRATGVLSHYLIHQTRKVSGSDLGDNLHLGTISRAFKAAVDSLGIDWGNKTQPTFHELRSLSKRLYDAQGGVDTKRLLGHQSDATAAMYAGTRGEWVKISAG